MVKLWFTRSQWPSTSKIHSFHLSGQLVQKEIPSRPSRDPEKSCSQEWGRWTKQNASIHSYSQSGDTKKCTHCSVKLFSEVTKEKIHLKKKSYYDLLQNEQACFYQHEHLMMRKKQVFMCLYIHRALNFQAGVTSSTEKPLICKLNIPHHRCVLPPSSYHEWLLTYSDWLVSVPTG